MEQINTQKCTTKKAVATCISVLLAISLSSFLLLFNKPRDVEWNFITKELNSSEIHRWRQTMLMEKVKDPEPFCSIPIDFYRNNTNIKYLNSYAPYLTPSKLEELFAKRLEQVPMCPNGNISSFMKHKKLFNNLPENLVPYLNKCKVKVLKRWHKETSGIVTPDPILVNTSDFDHDPLMGFMHVFKAGGTSIRDTIPRIARKLNHPMNVSPMLWKQYAGQLRAFLSSLFLYSFVRDPVSRTLSGHFEIRRRNQTVVAKSGQSGINSLRYMLKSMNNRLDCALANKHDVEKWSKEMNQTYKIKNIYYNIHILPQVSFLTAPSNPWGFWPINYIGFTKDIFNSTFEILYEFFMSKYITNKNDAYKLWSKTYVSGRDRHAVSYLNNSNDIRHKDAKLSPIQLLKYEVEKEDLSDQDYINICDLYWMDYMCFPFEIPRACNLTDLFLKHYGDDVVYNDCWDFTERDFSPAFVAKRKANGHFNSNPLLNGFDNPINNGFVGGAMFLKDLLNGKKKGKTPQKKKHAHPNQIALAKSRHVKGAQKPFASRLRHPKNG